MPVDPRIRTALEALPQRDESGMSVPERRAARMEPPSAEVSHELLKLMIDPVMSETDEMVGEVPVRIYRPREGKLPAVIWLHGGGWWMGDLDTNDGAGRWRSRDADCVVIGVGYRLAPEHQFPIPLDDTWAATRWVFDNAESLQIDPSRVVISGSSAGANLAAVVTQLARSDDDVSFAGQVLDVPIVDLTLATSLAEPHFEGLGLSPEGFAECVRFYLGEADPADPKASPLFGDVAGLPAALVNVCEFDPIRADGEAYARKLMGAGIDVDLRCWAGQVHGSMDMTGVVPDVAEAYRAKTVGFLKRIFQA